MEEQIRQEKNKSEIDLIEIITILWRARKFITIVTGISLVIAVIYILQATPMYKGSISLYAAQQGSSSPMLAMAKQFGVAGPQAGEANYNIPDIVKSRTLSEQIVGHKWDINGFDKKVNLVEYFDKLWKVKKPKYVVTTEDEIKWKRRKLYSYSLLIANNRINVNSNIKTGLISVIVVMENPILARDIANFISVFVTNWVNNTQNESIRKNLQFINERTTILDSELKIAENELKNFRETNRNILNSPDLQLELQRLQRQVVIKQEVYLTMIKQREINQIEENKSSDVIRILDKAIETRVPIKPNRRIIIFVLLSMGIILSSVFIAVIYLLKDRISNKFIRKLLNS